jgi:DNA-binding NtrC family response regulator
VKFFVLGDAAMVIRDLRAAPLKQPQPNDGQHFSALKIAARAASRHAERELILQALERTHWNRKRAGRELQISCKSLLYKIKQIGVQEEEIKGLREERQ